MTLISEVWSKVIPVNISEVQCLWNVTVWDLLRILKHLHILLGFPKGSHKFFVISFTKVGIFGSSFLFICLNLWFILSFGFIIISCLGECDILIIAVRSIFGMMFLILADISFPSKVSLIYFWNQYVHFITRSMVQMQVLSFLFCSNKFMIFWFLTYLS